MLKKFFSSRPDLFFLFLFIIIRVSTVQAQTPGDFLSDDERRWLVDHPTMRLGVGIAFPPFQWMEKENDQQVFKGMVSDYVRLFENRLGVRMQVIHGITFKQALSMGKEKKIDFFPCISKTVERSDYLIFTEPYLSYPLVIVTRENAPLISGVEDLNGKKLALVKVLSVYSKLRNDYPHLKIDFIGTENVGENLQAVSIGQADACIINIAAASYYIHKKGLTNLRITAPVNWNQIQLAMGVRNDWPIFLDIVKKTLATITPQEKAEIAQSWIRVRYEPEMLIRLFWPWALGIGGGIAFLFTIFFLWNRLLKREVEQRKRAENAISESEKRYRTLFESANDAIFILDGDKFIDCNPKALELFGTSLDDIIGKTPFDFLPPSRKAGKSEVVGKEILLKVLEGIPHFYEWHHYKGDGTPFYADIGLNRIHIKNKYHILAIARDISERKQMREEKDNLEQQLRQAQKMEAIGTLAGGIAHDFNNILAAIVGYSELALYSLPENMSQRSYLEQILKSSFRAKNLVQQILSFSRKVDQEKKPLQMSMIVKEALKLLRATLPTTIEIRQNLSSNIGYVKADPTQMHQVLINLCSNASDAMEDTGGTLEVSLMEVDLSEEDAGRFVDIDPGRYCLLSVKDTGQGMDAETMERIFEPYFTTKKSGKGTGLGLAMVHGIVKSHNGFVTVQSDPGHGTAFSVYIPLIEKKYEGLEIDNIGHFDRGNERVLFVDDEKTLVDLGHKALEFMGYRVTSHESSTDALADFASRPNHFDIVITDMTMPKMTGLVLSRKIRDIRKDIPIILCTGYSDRVTPASLSEIGIDKLMMKPLVIRELAQSMREILENKPLKANAD